MQIWDVPHEINQLDSCSKIEVSGLQNICKKRRFQISMLLMPFKLGISNKNSNSNPKFGTCFHEPSTYFWWKTMSIQMVHHLQCDLQHNHSNLVQQCLGSIMVARTKSALNTTTNSFGQVNPIGDRPRTNCGYSSQS
jgi:hypothetical protein